ncbi:aryl-alcohol dehydrogenase-like predicted oxidoreductase [Asanoa ferruginea]|uniref:Aryl-alcohol dehydrogenase-like predicted oxidoreductase n=1 Tax=Asanoa ferruginea TaxID=53367 RepID=A0A3D9ZS34_9ACTN|nr:aryl-alcohol dehydrogenase-like predicted oxidoreductase [Asanoa ferruginea]GIF46104.1 oxidoreductase [Asanoa ferruginea]
MPVHRIGLGLAALGRPGYINLGRDRDLPTERSVDAMRRRTHEVLDAAYAAGVRYVDAARSYGRAEEFLASWLDDRPDVVVGSKWGYTYVAGWRVDAKVHETKDHSVVTFDRQVAETRALLGARLDLYQIHSLTPDSSALTDPVLHRHLADLADRGVTIGVSTSGPRQADAIRSALAVEVDGAPLFHSFQATWNPLEPSAGPALEEAHAAGRHVIIKEALANGRLADHDAEVLAHALRQPWVDVVLSGAATTAQLASNLRALEITDPGPLPAAETPDDYWRHRSALPWS